MSDILSYYDEQIIDCYVDESCANVSLASYLNNTHIRILETCVSECHIENLSIYSSTLTNIERVVRDAPDMCQLMFTHELDKEVAAVVASRYRNPHLFLETYE